MLAEAMIAVVIAGTVAAVFTTINYYTHIQSNMLKQQNTKTILEVVRSRLINAAEDPDFDSYFELLKEVNDTIPINIAIGTDAWGVKINYSTIDLGTSDGTNAPYADTNTTISPNANIAGRLISLGQNNILETTSTDSTSQGDDLMLEIGVGEVNHFKLYGSSEITTETRGYNSAIMSTEPPVNPIHGALWYDTDAVTKEFKVWDDNQSAWVGVN